MSRDPKLYLEDILDSCAKIASYVKGMNSKAFHSDSKCVDAVIRNLEIIGEAVKALPENLKNKHPQIEWQRIAAFRNIVAHEYFGVDHDIVWDIVQNKIPALKKQASEILKTI